MTFSKMEGVGYVAVKCENSIKVAIGDVQVNGTHVSTGHSIVVWVGECQLYLFVKGGIVGYDLDQVGDAVVDVMKVQTVKVNVKMAAPVRLHDGSFRSHMVYD